MSDRWLPSYCLEFYAQIEQEIEFLKIHPDSSVDRQKRNKRKGG